MVVLTFWYKIKKYSVPVDLSIHMRSCQSFIFCLLVSQHSYLVRSFQGFVVERMHDVDVCAQQSSNAGVELNIPVWGGYLPTMAVEIFFLWTTLSPVRPESAVCIADYWGTDGNDQRKWATFLVHPTNPASAILSKRKNKHQSSLH